VYLTPEAAEACAKQRAMCPEVKAEVNRILDERPYAVVSLNGGKTSVESQTL